MRGRNLGDDPVDHRKSRGCPAGRKSSIRRHKRRRLPAAIHLRPSLLSQGRCRIRSQVLQAACPQRTHESGQLWGQLFSASPTPHRPPTAQRAESPRRARRRPPEDDTTQAEVRGGTSGRQGGQRPLCRRPTLGTRRRPTRHPPADAPEGRRSNQPDDPPHPHAVSEKLPHGGRICSSRHSARRVLT